MSAEHKPSDEAKNDYRIKSGMWLNAWKIAAGVGLLGLGGAFAGRAQDAHRFSFSYLFAFFFFLTIALGSIFFVLLQHLTSAGWSVSVRRTAEFFISGVPVFVLLFAPVVLGMEDLFPWVHMASEESAEVATSHGGHGEGHAEHAQANEHGEEHAGGGEHGPGQVVTGQRIPYEELAHEEHHELIGRKKAYLNKNFFLLRALIYFLAWCGVGLTLYRNSTRQDASKDVAWTNRSQNLAPVAVSIMGLTLTFAAFDWLMSLDPGWYSTIFGVQVFAGAIVATHAVIILVTLSLRAAGHTGNSITTEHYHDLGKLLFGFNVFWAYISFSQFFLIWYASIPEETVYYHNRWSDGPWKYISIALVLCHFVLPFALLLSRNVKRRLPLLALGAAILLGMQVVELYWSVMPNYAVQFLHLRPSDPTALSLHWMDIACFLGVGGVYLAAVFYQMVNNPVIPVGDPRLARSIEFENA